MSRSSLPPLEDDFSRALLGSAEADGPSNAAYAKAAATLGVGVGLSVSASLPASAAVAVGAAGAASAARWSSSLGVKFLALGVSGALLTGAGALLLHRAPPAHGVSEAASVTRPGAQSRPSALAVPASEPIRPPSLVISAATSSSPSAKALERSASVARAPAAPLVAKRVSHSAAAPAAAASAASAPAQAGGSSLAEQVQSLDRARVALGSGNSAAALREISHYRATWPSGVFLTEASVLEIEALAARGERSLAATRAADFVAAHPDSPQADRLRALIPGHAR